MTVREIHLASLNPDGLMALAEMPVAREAQASSMQGFRLLIVLTEDRIRTGLGKGMEGRSMLDFLKLLLHVLAAPFRTQAQLEAEITLLRHQLNVLQRQASTRPRVTAADRLLLCGSVDFFRG